MKRIGILGGSSDQSTAEYYRRLNAAVNERLGGWNTAELLMSSMNFALSERWVRTEDWDAAATYLTDRARALEAAGADLLICVSNTLHRVADRFTAGLQVPFLHIADPTARAIKAAGYRRVGLLGTRPVMATDFMKRRYLERFGITAIAPGEQDIETVDRIIFDELCRGRFLPESKARYLAIADSLAKEGCEAIILGCTEIPLLIQQSDRPDLPMLDTVALHVAATVEEALRS